MSFTLKVNKSAEAVKESTGSQFIGQSGIYDGQINFVSLKQTDSGAVSFNVSFKYGGNDQVFYGPYIQSKAGKELDIGLRLLNKFFIVGGLEDGVEPAMDTETHNVGRDNTPTDFTVITDLSELDCKLQVKEVYNRYKGEIKRNLELVNVFSENGETAEELTAISEGQTVEAGKQLTAILAREATTLPAYKDNKAADGSVEVAPTPEEVVAWREAKKSGAPAPVATTTKPVVNPFAKK